MSREVIEYVDPKDLIIIGLDTEDRHEHPLWDERVYLPVDEALVKNIIVYGIQQPVSVRKEGGSIFVVDGRQRVRAARKAAGDAGKAGEYEVKVPIRAVVADDKRIQGIMVATNELRKDDDILAKAFKAQRLLALVGDIDEVAIAFGRGVATIKNWLSLVEADPRVHAAIRSGTVSVTAAVEISRLKRSDQKEVLESLVSTSGGEKVSEAQAKAVVTGSDHDQAGASAGTAPAASPKPKPQKKSGRGSNHQQGIKRVWLRRALSTDAAKKLNDEQRAVLNWMATGTAAKGDWFDDFRFDAEAELSSSTAGKKKVKVAAPPSLASLAADAEEALPPEATAPFDTEDEEDVELSHEEIAAELAALAGGDSLPVEDTDDGDDDDYEDEE